MENLPTTSRLPLISLIIFNLLPLIGVIQFEWSLLTMMLMYWAESLVIGFFTVLRMALAAKAVDNAQSQQIQTPVQHIAMKIFLIPFFCMHFGGFMLGHLIFIFALFSQGSGQIGFNLGGLNILPIKMVALPLAGLFAYHLIVFIFNYIRPKAYYFTNAAAEMMHPYPRIIFTHIIILFIGFATAFLPNVSDVLIVAVLVITKTALDTYAYLKFKHKY